MAEDFADGRRMGITFDRLALGLVWSGLASDCLWATFAARQAC